jgi:hypothetical protein
VKKSDLIVELAAIREKLIEAQNDITVILTEFAAEKLRKKKEN